MVPDSHSRGFTLVEVVVALAISGLLLLAAHFTLTQIGDHASRVTGSAAVSDREANAERRLRSVVAQIDVGSDSGSGFGGNEHEVRFSSWCERPEGWQEQCEVTIAVDTTGSTLALTLTPSPGSRVVLRAGLVSAELRYLATAENGGTWFRVWGQGTAAPIAIGVIIHGDTTIVRIGERG